MKIRVVSMTSEMRDRGEDARCTVNYDFQFIRFTTNRRPSRIDVRAHHNTNHVIMTTSAVFQQWASSLQTGSVQSSRWHIVIPKRNRVVFLCSKISFYMESIYICDCYSRSWPSEYRTISIHSPDHSSVGITRFLTRIFSFTTIAWTAAHLLHIVGSFNWG